jgi:hypothetical protein
MAARWLARAARDAAGLCTKAAWHAALAASGVGGTSAAVFAFPESAAPLPAVPEPSRPPKFGPMGVAPGSGAALGCLLPAPPLLTC